MCHEWGVQIIQLPAFETQREKDKKDKKKERQEGMREKDTSSDTLQNFNRDGLQEVSL